MPRFGVYIPDPLHEAVKARYGDVNVSAIVQTGLHVLLSLEGSQKRRATGTIREFARINDVLDGKRAEVARLRAELRADSEGES